MCITARLLWSWQQHLSARVLRASGGGMRAEPDLISPDTWQGAWSGSSSRWWLVLCFVLTTAARLFFCRRWLPKCEHQSLLLCSVLDYGGSVIQAINMRLSVHQWWQQCVSEGMECHGACQLQPQGWWQAPAVGAWGCCCCPILLCYGVGSG